MSRRTEARPLGDAPFTRESVFPLVFPAPTSCATYQADEVFVFAGLPPGSSRSREIGVASADAHNYEPFNMARLPPAACAVQSAEPGLGTPGGAYGSSLLSPFVGPRGPPAPYPLSTVWSSALLLHLRASTFASLGTSYFAPQWPSRTRPRPALGSPCRRHPRPSSSYHYRRSGRRCPPIRQPWSSSPTRSPVD